MFGIFCLAILFHPSQILECHECLVGFGYFMALDLFFVLLESLALSQFVLSLHSHTFLFDTCSTASSGTFTCIHTHTSTHTPLIPILILVTNACKRTK